MTNSPQKGQIGAIQGKEKCPIIFFLTNTTLILVTTMHCHLHHELKNAWNVMKFYMYIFNSLIFIEHKKNIISKYSHKKYASSKCNALYF